MYSDGVNRKMQKDKMDAGCRNTTCIFFALYINGAVALTNEFS